MYFVTLGKVSNITVMDGNDGTSVIISWRPNQIGHPFLYYIIDVTQPGSHPKDDFTSYMTYNFSVSQISTNGDKQSVTVSFDQIGHLFLQCNGLTHYDT